MNVKPIHSEIIYRKMANSDVEKREDIYRYELMKPFEQKWACYHVPIMATTPGGYDVIMASDMLGYLSAKSVDANKLHDLDLLSNEKLWADCQSSIEKSLACFTSKGIDLPVKEYLYTLLLANPESPYIKLSDGYCGDGGIPGYIFASLVPNAGTMNRLPVALAHEVNHNVRFQFIKWRNDVTLAEMLINEGLAENFATSLYGEDMVGPWVSKTDMDTLNDYIKPIIQDGLEVQGLENLTSYLYGDELAALQNYFPVGLPYCAGYACGYYLIKHYLKKTGVDIVTASIKPAKEILKEVEDFWEIQTN